MNKILVVGLAAVLAATGNASADDHKGSKGQNNEAPAAPVVQNAPRPSAGGAPRYSTQLPRFNGYANSPEMRRYPGSLALQSSGLPYRGPSRSGKQFDGRVLPDQSTNGAPRRNWRHFDLVQKGDPNDANHNLSGRRTRDGQNFLPGQDTVNRHRGNRVSPNDGTTVANIGRKRGGNPVVAFNNGNAVSLSDAWRRCHDFGRGHDRDWWHRRCHTIILIGDGFWAWDAGWWYPAWGYDSSYSNYAYDGPIYGYDGLAPDQVIANVQGALQELGYFPYAVDGVLGPTTEQALADYQRDQGLYTTGAIDRPTLLSLGFIY